MKKNIILHLGVHKTATTYLQHILQENDKRLELSGMKAHTPPKLRELKYGHLLRSSLSDQAALGEFTALNESLIDGTPSRTIVISEENILGAPRDFKKCKSLYSHADKLLCGLSKQVRGHNVKILICLRSLSTFLPSIYCEYLRHNQDYLPFSDFYSDLNLKKASWFKLVESIQKNFPGIEIVAWDFAILKKSGGLTEILEELLPGVDPDDLSIANKVMRSGMTNKCVNLIHKVYNDLSTKEYKQMRRFLDWRMQWSSEDKFQPFSASQTALLDHEHSSVLAEISKMKTNVRLISS